jgi:hypothetical protein
MEREGADDTFVSSSQLKASILASDIAKAGTASVRVVNPSPGGGTSNVAFFTITSNTGSSVGFYVASSLAAGTGPVSVAVGDFNGDRKLDLAVTNEGSDTVSILLGDGTGKFTLASSAATGSQPTSVAVGDFNADGKLDLAVTNEASDTVSILLGDGTGKFTLASSAATGSQPVSVAVGDFNGDGKLDLAVANAGNNSVSILLGDGTGKFTLASSPALIGQPASVAVGDFNGDGKLDLAVGIAGEGNGVVILLGDGTGNFTMNGAPGTNGNGPETVALGDFNGDGILDLAVTNAVTNTVSILLGDGAGGFAVASLPATGSQPVSVAVGDFNGDGKLDLAVANESSNTILILLQSPTVSLSTTGLTFADQVVGTSSPSQVARLTNLGPSALSISSIAVTGTNASDFSQSNTCGSTLAPGAYCTISVTFKPTQIGSRTASVTIADSGVGSPQTIALSGTGVVSGPNATLSGSSLAFATQLVATTSAVLSVTLTDYGTAPLSITSIGFKGANPGDFAQSNTCGSLVAPGASCTISVTFKPTGINTRTASLSITDNALGSPQPVSLSGTGTVVELVPTFLLFCNLGCGFSRTKPVTLTNVGKTTLHISSITITDDFSQNNNCGSSLAAGASCTIRVTVQPDFTLDFGALAINDNGGGSPQYVSLRSISNQL